MRTHIIAAFLLASAPAVWAQELIAPPQEAAPTATAPFDERAEWCNDYASWLVAMTLSTERSAPNDVRESQHLEVELNSCKIDPQEYERATRAEADQAVATAAG